MAAINVPETATSYARGRALEALADDVECRVIKYYRVDSDYAGALFLGLEPNEPDRFTVVDLFAVSSLSVSIPARGARRFLMEPAEQKEISAALRSLPDGSLVDAEDHELEVMCQVYGMVKRALRRHDSRSSNAWVTASKLVARKRPDLFPVRDNVVSDFLDFRALKTVTQEYAVFRDLMTYSVIRDRLTELQQKLEKRSVEEGLILENSLLRLLDVALWTKAKGVRCEER